MLLKGNPPVGVSSQCTRDQFESSILCLGESIIALHTSYILSVFILALLVLVGEVILTLSRPSRNNLSNSPFPTLFRL